MRSALALLGGLLLIIGLAHNDPNLIFSGMSLIAGAFAFRGWDAPGPEIRGAEVTMDDPAFKGLSPGERIRLARGQNMLLSGEIDLDTYERGVKCVLDGLPSPMGHRRALEREFAGHVCVGGLPPARTAPGRSYHGTQPLPRWAQEVPMAFAARAHAVDVAKRQGCLYARQEEIAIYTDSTEPAAHLRPEPTCGTVPENPNRTESGRVWRAALGRTSCPSQTWLDSHAPMV